MFFYSMNAHDSIVHKYSSVDINIYLITIPRITHIIQMHMCVRVCVCARACVCVSACVRAGVRARVCARGCARAGVCACVRA